MHFIPLIENLSFSLIELILFYFINFFLQIMIDIFFLYITSSIQIYFYHLELPVQSLTTSDKPLFMLRHVISIY